MKKLNSKMVLVLGLFMFSGLNTAQAQELPADILKQADLVRSHQMADEEAEKIVVRDRKDVMGLYQEIYTLGSDIATLKLAQKRDDRIAKRDDEAGEDAIEARKTIAEDRQKRIEEKTIQLVRAQEELKHEQEELESSKDALKQARSETVLAKKTLKAMVKEYRNAHCDPRTALQKMGKGVAVIGDALGDLLRDDSVSDEKDVLDILAEAQCENGSKISSRSIPVQRETSHSHVGVASDSDSSSIAN